MIRVAVGYTLPIALSCTLAGLACLLGGYVLIGGVCVLLCGIWTYVSCICFFSAMSELD